MREGLLGRRHRARHGAGHGNPECRVAILLTPGFEEFHPALRGEFGHGRYANVCPTCSSSAC